MGSDPGGEPGWKRYAEAVRLWAPLVVSVCAISLTVFQASVARRHTRLSVQPRVDFRIQVEDDSGDVRLTLDNVGLGPGIVSDVRLRYAGEDLGDVGVPACRAMDQRIGRDGDDWRTACFEMGAEYVIPARDQVVLYASRAAPGLSEEARRGRPVDFAGVRVTGRYCSFYRECWDIAED